MQRFTCPFTRALTCPQLSEYRTKISEILLSAYGVTITPNPYMSRFLVLWHPMTLICLAHCMTFTTLLALSFTIMKWKHVSPLKSLDWIKEAVNCIKLEKIRYFTKSSIKLFYTIWKPFLDHIKSSTLVPDAEERSWGLWVCFSVNVKSTNTFCQKSKILPKNYARFIASK